MPTTVRENSAVLYVRKSTEDTRSAGPSRSTQEQEAECRAWAKAAGLEVVEILSDDGISASRHAKRKRQGWPQVLAMIEARQVGTLVTWETSRATRSLGDYATLRDLLRSTGTKWIAGGETVDLGLTGGIRAVVDEDEAERARERVLRAVRANATAGRPHGRRLYGYVRRYHPTTGAPEGQEPHPTEAPVVREVFARFSGGESLRAIATDLNERGDRTAAGAAWSNAQLHRMVSNPAYAGQRVHQGEVVGVAIWAALVDEATWTITQARLADPGRRSTREGAKAHLLSGTARCGLCGAVMRYGHDRGRRVYSCSASAHLTRGGELLDGFVSSLVIERLRQPDALAAVHEGQAAVVVAANQAGEEVAALRGQLEEATQAFLAGGLSAATLGRIEGALLPRINAAEKAQRLTVLPAAAHDVAAADDVEAAWRSLSTEEQRTLVRSLVEVTVLPDPRPRGSRGLNVDALRIAWR